MTATNMPDRIGQYRLTGVVGEGVGGVVYKAFDVPLQRIVALKVLRPAVPGDLGAARALADRLGEHAQAIARVNHPGIVAIHQVDADAGRAYIAMEYVPGLDLAQWLSVTPLPPQPALLQVMDQLLDALECAHQAGVRHGDLKPANVIVTNAGLVKLTDFGLARAQGRGEALAGVAPEYLSGRPVDHRVDIYAAGALLYRMLVAGEPYSDALADTAVDALGGLLRLPSTVAEAARPASFDAVAARALSIDPSLRYESAAEFRAALRAATQLHVPAHGTGSVTLDPGAPLDMGRIATMPGEVSGLGAMAAPADDPTRPLTIAFPDSLLAMPSHDPWAHGGAAPNAAADPRSLVANEEGYSAALGSQAELRRRASVVSAAAAATAALNAAADSAAAEAREPTVGRRTPPDGATIPTLMSLPREVPLGTGTGIVVSGPVAHPSSALSPAVAGADRFAHTGHLDLPLADDGVGIPAEALRRLTRILSAHFGEMATEILMRAAPRAGTVPELHALLLAQAGAGVDRKLLEKQLRAIARMPL